jgi:hypothetical protein
VTVNPVTDRANLNDDIVGAAELIRRSKQRYAVFAGIYYGRKHWQSATEIGKRIGLKRKRVVEEGKRIVDHKFARQKRENGDVWYARDPILYQNKRKIFAAAKDKKKRDAIPTRTRPHVKGGGTVIHVPIVKSNAPKTITVDDVTSFSAIKNFPTPDPKLKSNKMAEKRMKRGLQSIIGESHNFDDWGGEKNDLYTNKLKVGGKRKVAAFALKGKATKGPLTPKKMGKNGDQIGRLFTSDAEVFFVVYHGKIEESIVSSLQAHAAARSLAGQSVRYGIIDGDDLNRLYQAYKNHFS